MKQKLLNLKRLRGLMLLAVMCLFGAGTAWGAEEVYKTALFGSDYNSQSIGSYTATWTATNDDFTVSLANFNNNNNSWNYVKCGRKNNASVATITTSDVIDEAITKVAVTIDAITAANVNSIKLYTSSDNETWTDAGSFSKATGDQEVALSSPAANLYYKVEFDCASGSSNGLVTVSKVEYYYNPSGTVSPSISADDVSITYDATSGAIEYTINNGVDGGTLSATTEIEWLTIGTVGDDVPFTCAANENGERTATVTLTYSYGSERVAKNVIVTQAGNPNAPGSQNNPYTIAQARAAIDAGTGLTDVYATGVISQIDSYNSNYNSITYWISDDGTTTDQLEVYSGKGLNNTNFTSVNDIVVGATVVVYGTLKKYGDTYEFDKNNYLTSYTAPTAAVEAPTFSPAAGTYAEAQTVTIACATDGATIYYTTDGTEPTSASTQYTDAITVSTATTIKAIAIKGADESTVATAAYHICSADNPYTVTQALAFLEYPANGIYVSGIVSTAPTQAPTTNGQLTYYISVDGEATNQLQVYKGKGLEEAAFTAQDDIQVGDIVTIYGNVKDYNGTIEFDTNNYLVSFERPEHEAYTLTIGTLENIDLYIFDDPNGSEALTTGAQIPWGTTIYVSPDPADGYLLDAITVTDADNNSIDVTEGEAGMWTFTMPESNVTITATVAVAPATDAYELFTGDLVEGDYIIYYNGKAMNNTVNSDRLQYEEVTPEGDVITTYNANIVWHIAKSGDYWTIYNASANAYAASTGAKNKAQMLEDGTDDKALWTVTPDEETGETYEFVNKQNTTNEVNANLRNNGTYGFACYATGTGGALSLYKKVTAVEVTITSAGAVSFSSKYALDFSESGLTANIVTGKNGSFFTNETVTVVPAETGLVVEGEEGTYQIPVAAADATFDEVEGNLLVSTASEAYTVTSADYGFVYGLARSKSTGKVGFQKKAAGFSFGIGKSYLRLPEESPAKGAEFIYLNETVTGIKTVSNEQMNGDRYNLNGQRVDKNYKGVVIVNGKKMINK